jgi:antitoxin component YwqK of YwqJK toxin-antitoxin module
MVNVTKLLIKSFLNVKLCIYLLGYYKQLKPTTMKKILILGALVISAFAFAQAKKPVLEQEGNLVKATYYYDNGQIQQQGYFKEGKLEGSWVAFDEKGNKKSIGDYSNGEKTGKWFFWNDKSLSEVDYSNSRVASVKSWKQDALAKN